LNLVEIKKYIVYMTVEELLSIKISNEIDIQIMDNMLKSAKVPKKERIKALENMRKEHEGNLEREILGGSKVIHGID
jgi:hypothetical protein